MIVEEKHNTADKRNGVVAKSQSGLRSPVFLFFFCGKHELHTFVVFALPRVFASLPSAPHANHQAEVAFLDLEAHVFACRRRILSFFSKNEPNRSNCNIRDAKNPLRDRICRPRFHFLPPFVRQHILALRAFSLLAPCNFALGLWFSLNKSFTWLTLSHPPPYVSPSPPTDVHWCITPPPATRQPVTWPLWLVSCSDVSAGPSKPFSSSNSSNTSYQLVPILSPQDHTRRTPCQHIIVLCGALLHP